MRVVYFIDHLRPDGTQQVLTQLVRGLAERGHSQAVVCLNDSWDAMVLESLRSAGCQVRSVGKAALVGGNGLVATWRWLNREHFDAAVTLLFVSDVIGRSLARAAGVPHVVTYLQARNINYTGWQRWLVRGSMRWADRVVICSQNLRDFAVQVEGAPQKKVCVIPHGVRINGACQTSGGRALRDEFCIPADRFLVGSLGRLTYQKGYDLLLDALAHMQEISVQVLIAGSGELLPQLQSQAERLGIQDCVHFAGYRRDVTQILQAIDVYAQPSRFEGMPLAILEAMAASCPIVASAVDGNCELIEDGVTGWLVPAEDSRALAHALHTSLSNSQESHRRGQAACKRARDQFGLEQMFDRWEIVLGGGNVS